VPTRPPAPGLEARRQRGGATLGRRTHLGVGQRRRRVGSGAPCTRAVTSGATAAAVRKIPATVVSRTALSSAVPSGAVPSGAVRRSPDVGRRVAHGQAPRYWPRVRWKWRMRFSWYWAKVTSGADRPRDLLDRARVACPGSRCAPDSRARGRRPGLPVGRYRVGPAPAGGPRGEAFEEHDVHDGARVVSAVGRKR